MSHETVIKVKKRGKWHIFGDDEPEREHPPLPMPLRLPKPLSMDEDGTFDCPVETSCKCCYAKLWRFMAVWHETEWVKAYVVQWGRPRPNLPDDEAMETAQAVLDHFGVDGELGHPECGDRKDCPGAKQVMDEYGYCELCSCSLKDLPTANLGVCPDCYKNRQTQKEPT